ncbi:MAG: PAS domain S-box protein [Deltaproteobacteria bacterium]|nr:PAS domain S-box protein [Deltaproteobacteria bacterium]
MYVLKHTIAASGALALLIMSNAGLAAYHGAGPWSVFFALTLAGLAALLVFFIGRRVSAPLKDAELFLKKITEGDPSARLKSKNKDLDGLYSHLNRLSKVLKANEARLKDLMAAVPGAVIQLDRSGSITYLNDSAVMLTGLGAAEAAQSTYTDITPTQSHHDMKEVFRTVLNGQTVTGREMPILGKDCREIACELSAVPVWKGPEPEGCVLICRDVDEKKRLDAELKGAWMKAEEASVKLNKTIRCLEEFSLMAVRRELKMQEIRERLTELKKDTDLKKNPFDRTA